MCVLKTMRKCLESCPKAEVITCPRDGPRVRGRDEIRITGVPRTVNDIPTTLEASDAWAIVGYAKLHSSQD